MAAKKPKNNGDLSDAERALFSAAVSLFSNHPSASTRANTANTRDRKESDAQYAATDKADRARKKITSKVVKKK